MLLQCFTFCFLPAEKVNEYKSMLIRYYEGNDDIEIKCFIASNAFQEL